jgi:4-amino-4-deoxy-L-arabinose transferase-like glycosyltransferase
VKATANSSVNAARLTWCLIIFGIGLLSRTFFIVFAPFTSGDQRDYAAIAHNLVHYGQYAITRTSPTVFRPPLYPLFIAFVYLFAGERNEAVWIAQAIIGAASGVLLYLILRRVVREGTARFTAIMAAIYPNLSFYAATVLSETLLSASLVLMVYCVYRARGERRPGFAVAAGVTAALSVLIMPRFMGAPLIVAAGIWLARGNKPGRIKHALLSLVAALLVLTPWTVRNYATFGVFSVSSMQGPGLQFWLAAKRVPLYDWKWVELRRTEPLLQRYDELHNDEGSEQSVIRERAAIERELLREGVRVIMADPLGYLKDRADKYPRLWFQPAAYAGNFRWPFTSQNRSLGQMTEAHAYLPAAARILSITLFTLMPMLLVIVGVVLLLPRWKEHAVVYLIFAWVAIVQAPLFIEFRFSVVIHPLLAVFSATALERILDWCRRRQPVFQ